LVYPYQPDIYRTYGLKTKLILKGRKVKYMRRFLDDFWDYYRDLLPYKDAPSEQTAERLRSEFWKLYDTKSSYQQLDERKQLTLLKIPELLYVLEHPELPLHHRPAANSAGRWCSDVILVMPLKL
jgi:hypothetical protein